jgi:hypothetical protein
VRHQPQLATLARPQHQPVRPQSDGRVVEVGGAVANPEGKQVNLRQPTGKMTLKHAPRPTGLACAVSLP